MNDTRLLVKDDFLPNPEEVRAQAVAGKFETHTGPDGAIYTNIQIRPRQEFKALLEDLFRYEVEQHLTMVRANYAGELPHNPVHSDQICAEYACVLYLNTPAQCQGGTAFWKHKKLGWESLPTEKTLRAHGKSPKREFAKIDADWSNPEAWEQTLLAEMKFNRLIAYPSRRFHSRWPHTAFGTSPDDVRLIWVSFFNVKG